jgi:DNA mismatch repair protein MutL
MGIIRQLPTAVANQIAAGEVVERPASVAKELLENAIDAQATRIDLSVERGGKDLVRVADNGIGIAPDDLIAAFQPHATSKLAAAEDLCRIRTLGFRGEALAAIAEVSKVRCQSRQPGVAEGFELTIEGGVFGPVKSCGCPPGTVIEVRNLFQNIPVRRAFLKSDLTESGHVVDMFCRIALGRPDVHLTYRSGGKVVHDLPSVAGTRERIAVFFGRELAESLLWVEGNFDDMRLWGYVAHPSQSRSTAKGQYLFLGERYVRDRALSHALNEAYRGLLMTGRMPLAFLHLEIPPEEVDVNVHPTKVEVRFRDSQRVYSHLLSTLRQTFLKSDLHARLQVGSELDSSHGTESTGHNDGAAAAVHAAQPAGAGHGPVTGRVDVTSGPIDRKMVASWFEPSRTRPQIPAAIGRPEAPSWAASLPLVFPSGSGEVFDEFSHAPTTIERAVPAAGLPEEAGSTEWSGGPSPAEPGSSWGGEGRPAAHAGSGSSANRADAQFPDGRDLPQTLREGLETAPKAIQVHNSYLIVETGDGMMVIDQHALHERILYEELRTRVARGMVESQRLLAPEPVELSAAEVALILEQSEIFVQLGLDVESFGGETVLVRSIPAMLPHVVPEHLLRDLAEHFRTHPLPPTRDGLLADLLHMIACKAAIKAGHPLSAAEVAALLERRHLVADSHHCPHGRPTALVFTKADLEKQFGRI